MRVNRRDSVTFGRGPGNAVCEEVGLPIMAPSGASAQAGGQVRYAHGAPDFTTALAAALLACTPLHTLLHDRPADLSSTDKKTF